MNQDSGYQPKEQAGTSNRQRYDELQHLRWQVELLSAQVRASEATIAELRAEVDRLNKSAAETATRHNAAERQLAKAHKLRAAVCSLNLANTRDQFITALQEILANIVGTECFAVFESISPARMQLVSSMGIEESPYGTLVRDADGTVRSEDGTKLWVNREEAQLTSADYAGRYFIPLKDGSELYGLIVIFGLLPQKNIHLGEDSELWDLISQHASAALLRKG